ncbi:MAG: RNA polymerase sigma factor [Planctomycetota bacterium]|jgi:RNA polymerase sigma-70 factor (ECF subfamily)
MAYQDWTEMGGIRDKFLSTHWSLVEGAKERGDRDRALMDLLIQSYWKPVYCYLRRKGYPNERAKDLTQGFFHEVVLNRHLIERADSALGSFRSLLLHALGQYLIDEQRKEGTQKRIPRDKLVPLDIPDTEGLTESVQAFDPEESFNYAWRVDLLGRAMNEVRESYTAQGMEVHWRLFHDYVLAPILQGREPPPLKDSLSEYDLENTAAASHMLTTVKRRLQNVLKRQVRQMALTSEAMGEELQEIQKFFQKDGAQ